MVTPNTGDLKVVFPMSGLANPELGHARSDVQGKVRRRSMASNTEYIKTESHKVDRSVVVGFWAICMALLVSAVVWGQTTSGTVVGTVTDQTGAHVPGAKVTAMNEGTSISTSVLTDANGDYSIPLLNPGLYSIRAEKQGFKTSVASRIVVQVAQSTNVNFRLSVGALTQSVQVTAVAPLLQTANATVGQVINNKVILELPLNGRDFLALAVLSPGAITQENNAARAGNTSSYAAMNEPSVAGQRQDATSILLDGFMDTRPIDMTPAVRPTIDALQEFKIQDSDFTAESGRNPALVEIVTKSGTNAMHGDLWEFFRNNALDARNFFDTTIAPLRRNQFGAEVGGPVVIPKVFNGKNKTFFMFDWELSRFEIGSTNSFEAITPAMMQGDLSNLLPDQLYNPATTNLTTGVRQPFPGNIIPQSDLDPVAQKMMHMFEPTPTNPTAVPNTIGTLISPENTDQYTARVDDTFGKNSITVPFSWVRDDVFSPTLQPWNNEYQINTDVLAGMRWTISISPTMVNQARVGFLTSRTFLEQQAAAENQNLNALSGVANMTFWSPFSYAEPNVGCGESVAGVSQIYGCPSGPQSFKSISNVMEYGDDFTDLHGSHTLKFGFDILRSRNVWESGGATGNYSFNGTYTAQFLPGFAGYVPGTGNGIADFMLGQTIFGGITANLSGIHANSGSGNGDYFDTFYSLYAQDQWRVGPKLTVNYGLNWEYTGPYIEKYGRMSFPDLSAASKAMGGRQLNTCRNDAPYNPVYNPGSNFGRITNPSLCITNPGEGAREHHDLQPRLGLAYHLRPNTVLRAGGGLFYNNPEVEAEMAGMSGDPPFPAFFSLNSTSLASSQYPLDTLFPPLSSMVAQTTGRIAGPTLLGRVMPYTWEWNLTVQHEFTPNTIFEIGYMGSASHYLESQTPINQAAPNAPGTITPIVSRLPWPNYGGVGGLSLYEHIGNGNYNAGFVELNKRFSHGLDLLVSDTWSHDLASAGEAIGYVGPTMPWNSVQNYNCIECSYGNAPEDTPNRFVVSAVYVLPFGPGQAFLSSKGGAIGQLIGGWQLNLLGTDQAGQPLTCLDPTDSADVGFGGNCNYAPGHGTPPPQESFQKTGFAFDTSYFRPKLAGQEFGNTGNGILWSGPIHDVDFSLIKNFALTENKALQFRAEFFNLFNTTQFTTPDTSVVSPTFGQYLPGSANPAREIQLALKFIF
jgi:hypothetical protein